MNKPLVVTLLTSAILTLAAPAIGAPPNVSVTGGGTILDATNPDGGTVHVTVSARRPADAPRDEGATGNVTIKFPGEPAVHGTVDCLDVDPVEAAGLSGVLDNGLFFSIVIEDGDQEGVPDRAELFEFSTIPLTCRTRGPESDIIDGNFQVRFIAF